MDGPVLVFGGCYSNLEATTALLASARRLGIPPDRVVCTGDVVAYCADAHATATTIRDSGVHVVMGNCEDSLGRAADDCGCGFPKGSTCDRLSAAWFSHASSDMDDDLRAWVRSLPRRIDMIVGGRRLAVVHGTPDGINTYIFPSVTDETLLAHLRAAGVDGVVAGHSGLPFTRIVEGRIWHNAGAIGMPANDGTARGWYSVIEPMGDNLRIGHLPLAYDHTTAARKMRAAGLPEGYADALSTGFWPSCDLLPAADLAVRGRALAPGALTATASATDRWPATTLSAVRREKFSDPEITATGDRRAVVGLSALRTLWLNTGTLCNIACDGCFMESGPTNDRLAYIGRDDLHRFLAEADNGFPDLDEIGFTGGEPFMNPDILGLIEDSLDSGRRVLVLTNAMRPMQRLKEPLRSLHMVFQGRLALRVSLDHYSQAGHERIRGLRSWQPVLDGIVWLAGEGFDLAVAGRMRSGETEEALRDGYRALFERLGIGLDCADPHRLVLFPEMDERADVPEISEACWGMLGKSPDSVMCASSRMVVKRKGADGPVVVPCTLLPYEETFEMGSTLAQASGKVPLNHPHCAKFCVLGNARCSG